MVDRVKYRKGFTLSIRGHLPCPVLVIKGEVIDSNSYPHYDKSYIIEFGQPIHEHTIKDMTPELFKAMMENWLWSFEQHELREFFRFDDIKILDPHKNDHGGF